MVGGAREACGAWREGSACWQGPGMEVATSAAVLESIGVAEQRQESVFYSEDGRVGLNWPVDERKCDIRLPLRGRRCLQAQSVVTTRSEDLPERFITKLVAPACLEDRYVFQEKIHDAGTQSKVFRAVERFSGFEVIVKMRGRKFAVGGEAVWRTLLERMLNLEGHTHVLGLHDVLEDDEHYYIVMERCSGGELFDFLQTETDVPETECKRIMREILQAVDHMHSQGIIHRDIKPENIMFHDSTTDPSTPHSAKNRKTIKLIDFDTCQEYEPTSPKVQHVVGTMGYIAPEALKGDYTPSSDLWSVGVILYILMTGDMPFATDLFSEDPGDTRCGSHSMEELYERLKTAEIDFDCEPWPSFPMARDLCQRLLAFDPEGRSPSARDALQHPWLS